MNKLDYIDDLSFSCFVIGTTLVHRIENLLTTLKTIDSNNFPFNIKILSLDDFGEGVRVDIEEYAKLNNWLILNEPKKGMVQNQIKALNNIESDWVLYCEDDVIVEKLPTIKQIQHLLNKDNKTGVISLTGGGYNSHINHDKILDNIKKDVIKVGDDDMFWFRDPSLSNAWFFEFPSMFVRTNIFKNCISTSIDNFKSIQIEQAYTKSYFQLGYHMEYSRYTWTRDFNNHLNYNEHVISLINEISGKLIYIKHNRNNHLPSVGSGYFI